MIFNYKLKFMHYAVLGICSIPNITKFSTTTRYNNNDKMKKKRTKSFFFDDKKNIAI